MFPGEHADGVRLRALGELGAQLAFEGRGDEALVAVGDGDAQLVGEDARVPDHALFEQRDGGVGVRTHVHPEFAFLLAAVDGEDPVVRDARERLGRAVVRVVDGALLRVGRLGGERALPPRESAQRRDVLRVVGERFRHDVAGAREHGLGRVVGAARLRVARRQRARVAVGRRLCDHEQRERFEPRVARLRGAGGALLPVRLVQVLHALHDGGFLDLRAQGVRELALLVDGAQHVGLARLERAQVGQPLVQVAQRHVVQAARDLFAVARDEGDRVPLVHQRHHGGDLPGRYPQLLGDDVLDVRHGGFSLVMAGRWKNVPIIPVGARSPGRASVAVHRALAPGSRRVASFAARDGVRAMRTRRHPPSPVPAGGAGNLVVVPCEGS